MATTFLNIAFLFYALQRGVQALNLFALTTTEYRFGQRLALPAADRPRARVTSLSWDPAATWGTHSALKADVYFLRVSGEPLEGSLSGMSSRR
jgi:hypothetical protein